MEEKNTEISSEKIADGDELLDKKSKFSSFTAEVILKELIRRKNFVLKILVFFLILGVIISFLTPKEYTATSLILPQVSQDKGLGKKFGNFAALVGLKLGQGNGTEILPTLYPIIVKSTPFERAILETPLQINGQEKPVKLSYYLSSIKKTDFLTTLKSYTIGLPGMLVNKLKSSPKPSNVKLIDSSIYKISRLEQDQIDFVDDNLLVNFNNIEGYIEISFKMSEPIAASQLAKNAQDVLQKFIIDFNIQKAQDELDFIDKRYSEAKEDYLKKKIELGNYKDRNQNYIFSVTKNRLDELKEEYDLSYDIYSQLAAQAETARLQVKKDTPIFTVLKPVGIPLEPSSPSLLITIIKFLFIGLVVSIFWILVKLFYPEMKVYLKK